MESAVIIGGTRLPKAEELALNEMLRRSAGECHGMPLYRVTWAGEDNRGLARKHMPGCPKSNPMDWTCDCPMAEPWLLPVCWHENQQSYHLLSWEPPTEAHRLSESQTRIEGFVGEDYSKGTYACLLHFIDPRTHEPLTNILPVVVEQIIPRLRAMKEMVLLAQHGANAAVQSKREQRARDIKQQVELQQARDRQKQVDMLTEVMRPGFDGKPFSAPGRKGRHSNEVVISDLSRGKEL